MNISPYSLHFYNNKSEKLQQNIWNELKKGIWKNFKIDNFLLNSKISAEQPHKMQNIFEEFKVVYPGTSFNTKTKHLEQDLFSPNFIKTDKNELYKIFENYFNQFSNKKTAVHLSGGLDSSIIIGLLHHFKIPFYLVGLVSHRFEFRTEKAIQEKLSSLGKETVLIDMDDYPSFSNLKNKPLSQLPDSNIKQVEAGKAIVRQCKRLNVDVVFTGQGGDTIFVDDMSTNKEWKCNIGNEFIMDFESQVLYPDEGIELVSPFADKNIIQALYSLRKGEKGDHLKKWARQFFKDVLPRELVEYTYCADFFGTSMSGLDSAKPEIRDLFNTAYDITQNKIFSQKKVNRFLAMDVFDFEYQDYIDYCNKISLATWYNGLLREGYVK